MKQYTKLTTLIIALIIGFQANAQDSGFKKADKYYNNLSYVKAIKAYESVSKKNANVYRNLAKSYLVLGNTMKAEENYAYLMSSGDYKPEDIYDYASVLLMNQKYNDAKKWMKKYAQKNPGDERVEQFLKNPEYFRKLMKVNEELVLTDAGVNTSYEDFSPAYYGEDKVVFASSRNANLAINRKWSGNDQPFLDLFMADVAADNLLSDAKNFTTVVNKKFHDGPVAFNKASDFMVVTRNMYNKGEIEENKLWLYDSNLQTNSTWSTPRPLHFNSKDYQCGHATLSQDAQMMYFVSDMPGGKGKTDIYVVDRKSDGTWGTPRNVGKNINTRGKEMFPYLSPDGQYLFFSSDGWPGLGGLDIFVAKIRDDGSITKPINLGTPINSSMDDFSLIYKTTGTGFLSSNRPGGHGDDDIYSYRNLTKFKKILRDWKLSGTITDKNSNQTLENAVVNLYDVNGKELGSYTTKSDGHYDFLIGYDQDYKLIVNSLDYEVATSMASSKNNETGQVIKDFALERNIPKKMPLCELKVPTLYYDLDKYYIKGQYESELDHIVSLLNDYPEMKLEIISHTDCRASKAYNVRLSKNRTNSVVKYLLGKGVDINRLVPKWKGETQLINACSDNVKCSEEEHQQNRRTEFIIANCKK